MKLALVLHSGKKRPALPGKYLTWWPSSEPCFVRWGGRKWCSSNEDPICWADVPDMEPLQKGKVRSVSLKRQRQFDSAMQTLRALQHCHGSTDEDSIEKLRGAEQAVLQFNPEHIDGNLENNKPSNLRLKRKTDFKLQIRERRKGYRTPECSQR